MVLFFIIIISYYHTIFSLITVLISTFGHKKCSDRASLSSLFWSLFLYLPCHLISEGKLLYWQRHWECSIVCECTCMRVRVCVAKDLTKQNHFLWHKSSELDSRRGRQPCNLTSTQQQAQTHLKANPWTCVPLCQHTSIKSIHFFPR